MHGAIEMVGLDRRASRFPASDGAPGGRALPTT